MPEPTPLPSNVPTDLLEAFTSTDSTLSDVIGRAVDTEGLEDGPHRLLQEGVLPGEWTGTGAGTSSFRIDPSLIHRLGAAKAWRVLAALGLDASILDSEPASPSRLIAVTAFEVVDAEKQGKLLDLFEPDSYAFRILTVERDPSLPRSVWADLAVAHMERFVARMAAL